MKNQLNPEHPTSQQNHGDFRCFLNHASTVVKSWPLWRQALLGGVVVYSVEITPNADKVNQPANRQADRPL